MRLTTPLALVGDDQGGTPPDREAPHIRRREETRRGLLRLTTPLPPLGNDRKVGRTPPDQSRGESTEIYDDTGGHVQNDCHPCSSLPLSTFRPIPCQSTNLGEGGYYERRLVRERETVNDTVCYYLPAAISPIRQSNCDKQRMGIEADPFYDRRAGTVYDHLGTPAPMTAVRCPFENEQRTDYDTCYRQSPAIEPIRPNHCGYWGTGAVYDRTGTSRFTTTGRQLMGGDLRNDRDRLCREILRTGHANS